MTYDCIERVCKVCGKRIKSLGWARHWAMHRDDAMDNKMPKHLNRQNDVKKS